MAFLAVAVGAAPGEESPSSTTPKSKAKKQQQAHQALKNKAALYQPEHDP